MKKITKYLALIIILLITGCMSNQSMDNITIYTTSYPIEYITNRLYGSHSTIKGIYPNGVDINTYKINPALISEYKDSDLYIFNGLSNEKNYVYDMRKTNKSLKIIDVTTDLDYNYAIEELWLNPNNLLSLANNIRKGFNEYIIDNAVLTNEVNENFKALKEELTQIDAKYREELTPYKERTIVVSDDMFMFLENYGLTVISLDKDNENYDDNLKKTMTLMNNGYLKNIFVPEGQELDSVVNSFSIEKIQLHTISNLTDSQRENYDYISLVNENLEIIKKQLATY